VQPDRTSTARPSLASTQSAVMALITGREAGTGVPDVGTLIVGDARASVEERMHVYAHMYRARIVEALESQFPRLAKLLGPNAFTELAIGYISDEPSRSPSLRDVGARLPAWLRGQRPASSDLAGLASLEWARVDVFDLADEPTLSLAALRSWPTETFGELPLRLIAAHRLVKVPVGTLRLWDTLGAEVVYGRDGAPDDAGSQTLVVWRDGTLVYHRPVTEAERAALELAASGTRFGVVCESLLATLDEEAAVGQAFGWMSTWLADGLLHE
jgi:hypothetical protein